MVQVQDTGKAPWEIGYEQPPSITTHASYAYSEPSVDILPGSDLDLRMKAVDQAVNLYKDKAAVQLGDYNTKFEELINKIYKFYVANKELH